MDAIANFAYSTVLTAPSPATSGTSITVQSGDGAKYPTPPFNCVAWPEGQLPLLSSAEIVRVTARPGNADTFTIVRQQESTSAQAIAVGWQFANMITALLITQLQSAVSSIVSSFNTRTGAVTLQTSDIGSLFSAAGQIIAGTGNGTAKVVTAPGSSNLVLTSGGSDGSDLQWTSPSTAQAAWPVGSVFISTVSTNPATLLGFGTWTAYAQGQVLIGTGTSDQTFTAGATGGASNVTLTAAQSGLPASSASGSFSGGGSGTGSASVTTSGLFGVDNIAGNGATGGVGYLPGGQNSYSGSGSAFVSVSVSGSCSVSWAGFGASQSHNNLQPYIVVYIWNRTS